MSCVERCRAVAQNRSFSPILRRVTSQSTSQGLESELGKSASVQCTRGAIPSFAKCPGQNDSVFHFSTSPHASARILPTGTAEALLMPAEDFLHGDTSTVLRRLHGAESTTAELPEAPLITKPFQHPRIRCAKQFFSDWSRIKTWTNTHLRKLRR